MIEADINVSRFGFVADEAGSRLLFPQAQAIAMEGTSGDAIYGASQCNFTGLEGRLGALRWKADAAEATAVWLRDRRGRFEIAAGRVDLPRGVMLVRGADHAGTSRLELVAPEVEFSDLRITINDLLPTSAEPPSVSEPTSRQRKLQFLDGLSGAASATLKVCLDLPVLGLRTLDQELRIPIQDGAIDFRALEESLHWLGDAFLDVAQDNDRLRVRWKVPIVGRSRDLITWPLDSEASALATFGRVPVRSLTEPSLGASKAPDQSEAATKEKRKILSSTAVENIHIAVSLQTPHNLELEPGVIGLGADDQPGLVDLQLAGNLHDQGPGNLKGAVRGVDITVKDLRVGPLEVTADRIQLEGIDPLEIAFDGLRPTSITLLVGRATATNLSLKIG